VKVSSMFGFGKDLARNNDANCWLPFNGSKEAKWLLQGGFSGKSQACLEPRPHSNYYKCNRRIKLCDANLKSEVESYNKWQVLVYWVITWERLL